MRLEAAASGLRTGFQEELKPAPSDSVKWLLHIHLSFYWMEVAQNGRRREPRAVRRLQVTMGTKGRVVSRWPAQGHPWNSSSEGAAQAPQAHSPRRPTRRTGVNSSPVAGPPTAPPSSPGTPPESAGAADSGASCVSTEHVCGLCFTAKSSDVGEGEGSWRS